MLNKLKIELKKIEKQYKILNDKAIKSTRDIENIVKSQELETKDSFIHEMKAYIFKDFNYKNKLESIKINEKYSLFDFKKQYLNIELSMLGSGKDFDSFKSEFPEEVLRFDNEELEELYHYVSYEAFIERALNP